MTLVDADDPAGAERSSSRWVHWRSTSAAGAVAVRKLALERVDGEPAISSPLGPALRAHGFQEGPRRLTLSA